MQTQPATIILSQAEADAAIQLFDFAVKAQGLKVAQNALALTVKIQTAFSEANKPKELAAFDPAKET